MERVAPVMGQVVDDPEQQREVGGTDDDEDDNNTHVCSSRRCHNSSLRMEEEEEQTNTHIIEHQSTNLHPFLDNDNNNNNNNSNIYTQEYIQNPNVLLNPPYNNPTTRNSYHEINATMCIKRIGTHAPSTAWIQLVRSTDGRWS